VIQRTVLDRRELARDVIHSAENSWMAASTSPFVTAGSEP
jgi:hypothetical protein